MGDQIFRLRYVGQPPFASAVAQTLREEGIDVSWTRPEERRDETTDAIIVNYVCHGAKAGMQAAIEKIRERLGPSGNVDFDERDQDPGAA